MNVQNKPEIHPIEESEITEFYHEQTEKALRSNVENFRAILNSVGDAMITIDTGRTITGMNPKAEELTGWKEVEAKGILLSDIVNISINETGGNTGYTIEQFPESRKTEGTNGHLLLIARNGNKYRVSVSSAPIKNIAGKMNGIVLVMRDVTEEYTLQRRIIESEKQFRSLYNSMTEGVCQHEVIYDESGSAIDYRIIDINTAYEKILDMHRTDVVGKLGSEVYKTDEAPYLEIFSDVVGTGNPVQFELYFRPLNKHFSVSAFSTGKGKFAAVFEDISELKRADEQIRLQSAALEASANAVLITDRNGIIEFINPAFSKLTGYSETEAIGKNPRDLVKSDKHDSMFYKNIWDRILSGSTWHGDIINRRKDGSLYNEEQTIAPVKDAEGEISHFIAIKQDVTERKQAEQTLHEQQRELTKLNKLLEEKIDIQAAELHLAAQIQKNLLPGKTPVLSGYDMTAVNIPANEIGGDYFDFIRLDDHRVAIVLGDVSGKGLSASLLVANLQAVIRGQVMFTPGPKECMERANKLFFHSTDSDKFATLFYGILDTQKNTIRYVNAGHNPPIIYSPGTIPVTLDDSGLLLGAFEDVFYEEKEILIEPNDYLIIYSDGVCEAMNDIFEEFSEEKLLEIIRRNGTMDPKGLAEKITSAIKLHARELPQSDDMTMILVKRK
jgi:PAS domain S-box-containing protein